MPWKESVTVNLRMHFVARVESGERMSDLCREFGISRKTGYKFLERFKERGPIGLYDLSRRPLTNPAAVPQEVRKVILALKEAKPTWGAAKIRVLLHRKHPTIKLPARSTVHDILAAEGLVKPRRIRRRTVFDLHPPLASSRAPNDLWCADFKGQFRTADQRYCYPLTVSDHYSRFLLCCEALDSTKGDPAQCVFDQVFTEYGLPEQMLTDNGPPFGCPRGLFGLSRLNVWWLKLGIKLQRIQPGHPEQNGRHERMHLTLKQDATRPAGANLLHQQERFDGFRYEFNTERPHESLGMRTPAGLHTPSGRMYRREPLPAVYPLHDRSYKVDSCGKVFVKGDGIDFYLSQALEGEHVGLREDEDDMWLVSFLDLDLGYFDASRKRFDPFDSLNENQEELDV